MGTGSLKVAARLTAGLACALLATSGQADVGDAVNWARLQGCPDSAATVALRSSAGLAKAASRLAGGQSLHDSLTAVGYPAVQSTAIHLSGAVNDAALERALAARDCGAVADPRLTQMGAQRRGRDVWLVLAAPAPLPSMDESESLRRQVLTLVNDARAKGRRCGGKTFAGVGPLLLSAALTGAAVEHSLDMAAHADFDHRGHDGSTPRVRVARAGFGAVGIVGENIAAGAMTPAEVTEGWLASPPHCENIMDPRFTVTGIAFAVNMADAELVYWTQDFAAARRR